MAPGRFAHGNKCDEKYEIQALHEAKRVSGHQHYLQNKIDKPPVLGITTQDATPFQP
jgi:hypothetical protein